MRPSDRTPRRRIALRFVLLLAGALGAPAAALLSAEETNQVPIRANAIADAAGVPALASGAAPLAAPDFLDRVRAARAAAASPGQPVPQASPEASSAATPAPLAARIGRDVTVVPRPGVGTPMQIRGPLLQERAAAAAPGEDLE